MLYNSKRNRRARHRQCELSRDKSEKFVQDRMTPSRTYSETFRSIRQ